MFATKPHALLYGCVQDFPAYVSLGLLRRPWLNPCDGQGV
jgi:hypothetical protein